MMATVLHYRALDRRGEEILNELERCLEFHSSPGLQKGERSYFLVGSDESNLELGLDTVDPSWEEHVTRVPAWPRP